MNKPIREGFVEASEPVDIDHPANAAVDPVAPPQPPVPELPDWPMVIKLNHKPIEKSKTELLHELTFREPTAMDIIRCGGNPCRIEITELTAGQLVYNPVIDDAKMMRLMANLTGLLEPQLQKMDPRDYNSCAHRLRRFFLPEQGIW